MEGSILQLRPDGLVKNGKDAERAEGRERRGPRGKRSYEVSRTWLGCSVRPAMYSVGVMPAMLRKSCVKCA